MKVICKPQFREVKRGYGRIYLPDSALTFPQVEASKKVEKTFPQVDLFPNLFPTRKGN
uniref:Uncharacterized protein n=1 Tax=Siphoviridae sp. ctDuC3 TaxID=2827563 RepID=A0A8S5LMR6_9CAUD|nr:MAG TPA: hypothetical protein [Siphoviridae sp. ctDuC3]